MIGKMDGHPRPLKTFAEITKIMRIQPGSSPPPPGNINHTVNGKQRHIEVYSQVQNSRSRFLKSPKLAKV